MALLLTDLPIDSPCRGGQYWTGYKPQMGHFQLELFPRSFSDFPLGYGVIIIPPYEDLK